MYIFYIFIFICTITLFSHRNGWLYVAAFSAVLGNFIFGYAKVFPSVVIPQLQKHDNPHLHMNDAQISWFGVRAACFFCHWISQYPKLHWEFIYEQYKWKNVTWNLKNSHKATYLLSHGCMTFFFTFKHQI